MFACSYNQVLHFDLMKSGIFSVLPWMTMAVTSNIGGWIADKLVQRGVTVTRVRKIMQTVCGAALEPSASCSGWGRRAHRAARRDLTAISRTQGSCPTHVSPF